MILKRLTLGTSTFPVPTNHLHYGKYDESLTANVFLIVLNIAKIKWNVEKRIQKPANHLRWNTL